ncbi:MAG TPA: hypothetical protein VK890_08005 [Bacteroidia bacterium]|jgi:hypothetical protein|nr:hypothetical protein [Bacteroidia bacterium]
MKKFFIIVLFCCSGLFARAQFIDTIQNAIDRKGSFSFSFTSRNSFITNYTANIWGFAVGVTFGKKLTIGGGYNFLNSTIAKKKIIGLDTVNDQLNFAYFSYFIQYIIRLHKHWKLYLEPISIGIGSSNYQYTLKGVFTQEATYTVIPYEPSVELDYNFNKWFGLYTVVGYRLMIINNPDIVENFNSPTYSFGILISPFELYAAIFPRTKLAKMIEAP